MRPGQRTGPRQKASSTATTCWSQGAAKHQPLLSIVKHLLCMYSTHVTRKLLYDRAHDAGFPSCVGEGGQEVV